MAEYRLRILAIDDDADFLADLEHMMDGRFCLRTATGAKEARATLATDSFDAVLLDLDLGAVDDGLDLLDWIRSYHLDLPVIVVTADRTTSSAVKALRRGASDYVDKSPDLADLERRIVQALDEQRRQRQSELLREEIDAIKGEMIGDSAPMCRLRSDIAAAAQSRSAALISGETGTGKELVARALHRQGAPTAPFVAINCAEHGRGELFSSKLFGTELGAFTGAISRPGVCETVGEGVLFLDEITEIPEDLQSQLLRMLDTRDFCRLGGTRQRRFLGRIVASTNRIPEQAVRDGTLRLDLYYRLQTYRLTVPPLRKRIEDIPLLAEYFRVRKVRELKTARQALGPREMARLCAHDWPGNVRELQSEIERYVAIGRLSLDEGRLAESDASPIVGLLAMDYHEAKAHLERQLVDLYVIPILAAHQGNKANAAAAMGISRQALSEIVKRFDLKTSGEDKIA